MGKDCKTQYKQEVKDSVQSVGLGGDGRAQTSRHCVKYDRYTTIDLDKIIVIDVQLVQACSILQLTSK